MKKGIRIITLVLVGVFVLGCTSVAFAWCPTNEVGSFTSSTYEETFNVYAASVRNPNGSSAVDYVDFAVWTEAGGQDDLIWQRGTRGGPGGCTDDPSFETTVDYKDHGRELGKYIIHAYAMDYDGTYWFIGSTTVEILYG